MGTLTQAPGLYLYNFMRSAAATRLAVYHDRYNKISLLITLARLPVFQTSEDVEMFLFVSE